jgi:predicted HTH domain antitoxin
MHTLTLDEVSRQPSQLLDDVDRGEPALVMRGDQPLFMAVPLAKGLDALEVRLELAVTLFDQEQVSLGIAARIAGLSISGMIDELGRRKIPVVRYTPEELARELEYARTLADRG